MKKCRMILAAFVVFFCVATIEVDGADTSKKASFVQEEGEWIYYLDDVEMGYLCKIKKDGTGYQKLYDLEASSFMIVEDWIYYIKAESIYHNEGELYRIRLDGTEKKQIFKDKWEVNNLAYSNGYISFYAGNMYKMSITDLKAVELKDWMFTAKENKNGYLIAYFGPWNQISTYNMKTDEVVTFKEEEVYSYGSYDIVCDEKWIYYVDNESGNESKIVKVDYQGKHREILYDGLSKPGNLQLYHGNLYFRKRTKIESDKWGGEYETAYWKGTVDGAPLTFFTDKLGETAKFYNIIDDKIYIHQSNNLGIYDIEKDSFAFMPMDVFLLFEHAVVVNEKGNMYYTLENKIMEVSPTFEIIRTITDLQSLDGTTFSCYEAEPIYYSNGNMVFRNKEDEVMLVNLFNMNFYTIEGADRYIGIRGIDDKYIYLSKKSNEATIKKLYRMPLGDRNIANMEHIWDVDDTWFVDGYVINQRISPNYDLSKMNLRTLEKTKISTHFIYGSDIGGGNLYYAKGNNGAVYKNSIKGASLKKIVIPNEWVSDLAVNSKNIFFETWKYGIRFYKADLNGKNVQVIGSDTISEFIEATDEYVYFVSSAKFAVYDAKMNQSTYLYELRKNPKPASMEGSSVFYDVKDTDWFAKSLYKLHEMKLVSGNNGYYKPQNKFKVDQFLKTLCIALHGEVNQTTTGYWAQKYIDFAIEKEYITDNQFDTYTREITRGEMAVTIAKALKIEEVEEEQKKELIAKIKDYEKIDAFQKEAVLKVYNKEIITGYGDGTFRPEASLKRSEAAVIISRILKK